MIRGRRRGRVGRAMIAKTKTRAMEGGGGDKDGRGDQIDDDDDDDDEQRQQRGLLEAIASKQS